MLKFQKVINEITNFNTFNVFFLCSWAGVEVSSNGVLNPGQLFRCSCIDTRIVAQSTANSPRYDSDVLVILASSYSVSRARGHQRSTGITLTGILATAINSAHII